MSKRFSNLYPYECPYTEFKIISIKNGATVCNSTELKGLELDSETGVLTMKTEIGSGYW